MHTCIYSEHCVQQQIHMKALVRMYNPQDTWSTNLLKPDAFKTYIKARKKGNYTFISYG